MGSNRRVGAGLTLLEEWCLIGERSHVSGGMKSEREYLCKFTCRQIFPFAFTAPLGAPQSNTATTAPNNEKRSFSQSLLRRFSRRKAAIPSVPSEIVNCEL